MPELPEVETVKRGLEPVLLGQVIASVDLRRPNLRFAFPSDFTNRLNGARITAVTRRAKYILASLNSGDTLLMHLGMTGRFTILKTDGSQSAPGEFYDNTKATNRADGPHDHVLFTFENGTRIVYSDPRRFGMMDLQRDGDTHPLLKDLGVEPLGNELDANVLHQRFENKSAPLKAALLDQRIIAGLGNIYVCEALFRAKLAPTRKAGTLVKGRKIDPRLENLVRHIRDILNEAIRAGGSTLQDYQGVDGTKGEFQQRFAVYDREGEPCTAPSCTSTIQRQAQSGRSTFYCPTCQK